MKIRTLLLILLAMGAVYVMASLFVANRELLEREFHFGGGYDLKVELTLLIFLVAGVAFATAAGLTREASKLMDGWKRRKEDRRSDLPPESIGESHAALRASPMMGICDCLPRFDCPCWSVSVQD